MSTDDGGVIVGSGRIWAVPEGAEQWTSIGTADGMAVERIDSTWSVGGDLPSEPATMTTTLHLTDWAQEVMAAVYEEPGANVVIRSASETVRVGHRRPMTFAWAKEVRGLKSRAEYAAAKRRYRDLNRRDRRRAKRGLPYIGPVVTRSTVTTIADAQVTADPRIPNLDDVLVNVQTAQGERDHARDRVRSPDLVYLAHRLLDEAGRAQRERPSVAIAHPATIAGLLRSPRLLQYGVSMRNPDGSIDLLGINIRPSRFAPENQLIVLPSTGWLEDYARGAGTSFRGPTFSLRGAGSAGRELAGNWPLVSWADETSGGEFAHPMPKEERPVYVEDDEVRHRIDYDGYRDAHQYRGHATGNGATWSELMESIDTLINEGE